MLDISVNKAVEMPSYKSLPIFSNKDYLQWKLEVKIVTNSTFLVNIIQKILHNKAGLAGKSENMLTASPAVK